MSEKLHQNPNNEITPELLQGFANAVGELLPIDALKPSPQGAVVGMRHYRHPYFEGTVIEVERVMIDGEEQNSSLRINYPAEGDGFPQAEGFGVYKPVTKSQKGYNYQPKMPEIPEMTMEEMGMKDHTKYLLKIAFTERQEKKIFGDKLTAGHIQAYTELLTEVAAHPELRLPDPTDEM